MNSAAVLPEKLLLVVVVEVVVVEAFGMWLSFNAADSSESILFKALEGGLANIGVSAFRKSV